MKKKNLKFLKTLLETPSPTGSEVPVANLVRERLADTADEIETVSYTHLDVYKRQASTSLPARGGWVEIPWPSPRRPP